MMRALLALFLLLSAAAAPAQPQFVYVPGYASNPSAEYVTAGQDEPGYRRWVALMPTRAMQVSNFNRYLTQAGVGQVVPTWQLLRTATDWQRCWQSPFEMPPVAEWPNIVQTLRYIRDYVVPVIGPVEPVSVYRNPFLNHCAGGARESVHLHLSAIDMVPLSPTTRPQLMRRLCSVHAANGPRYSVGLGFYTKLRFHVDSWKFRTWGRNDAGTTACPASYELAHRADPAPPLLSVTPAPAGSQPPPAAPSVPATSTQAPAAPPPAVLPKIVVPPASEVSPPPE